VLCNCGQTLIVLITFASATHARTIISTSLGTSFQVNVDSFGQNISGDAADEPSLCQDPADPNRIAIGWRQFNSTNSNFRQAGYGFSTNAGTSWTFGGVLETNVFRSDPVLASDGEGRFLLFEPFEPSALGLRYLALDQRRGQLAEDCPAVGGDKAWMTIDTTRSPGHDTIAYD
jgi:hypothetical protein